MAFSNESSGSGTVRMVRALYDYEYEDDHNEVIIMKEGEIYYLLNGEGEDWWRVRRPNTLASFYVPRTYVEILGGDQESYGSQEDINDSVFSGNQGSFGQEANSQSLKMQLQSESNDTNKPNNGLKSFKPQMEGNKDESLYINYNGGGKNITNIQVHYVGKPQRPTDFGISEGGEYANLEDLRAASGIQQPVSDKFNDQSPDSDYANLQQLNIEPPSALPEPTSPPLPEQSKYQKTLMAKWDMYLDPATNRVFYVHKDTKERNWKPPRDRDMPGTFHHEMYKQRSRSSGDYEEVLSPLSPIPSMPAYANKNRKSRSLDYGKALLMPSSIPEGWSYEINDEGKAAYIHETTKQKRMAGENSPTTPTDDKQDTFPKSQSFSALVDQKTDDRSKVSDRYRKSRSVMIENLQFHAPPPNSTGPPPPKSATLPSNFQAPIPEKLIHGLQSLPPSPKRAERKGRRRPFWEAGSGHKQWNTPVDEVGSRQDWRPDLLHHVPPFSQSCQLNEPIEGIISKARIEKGGKMGKKNTSYVKLEGTNLVFHHIHKRSKPGAIDYMVPLQTCTVEKNPKEFGKKYSILVTTEDPASQTLLLYDDEAKMLEWFLRLQMKIKEVGGPAEPSPVQLTTPLKEEVVRKPSFKNKKGHSRSDSRTDNSANKGSLKDFLQFFFTNRKNLTEIQDKGIYKDAVFGAELKQLCDKEKVKVPIFVTRSIEAIEKRGLDHEGIYRIGGNISQIQKLRCMVDQDEIYDLDDPTWDMNVLTGALKLFFRELKEPLFTFALFDKFLNNYMKELNSERLKGVRNTMHDLPKCHYETVKFLFKHLNKIMDLSKENKMQAHQLAIVFGPTLIWPQVQSNNLATSMVYQSRIVEYVLMEYKNIFR